jgi:hypothetical protein
MPTESESPARRSHTEAENPILTDSKRRPAELVAAPPKSRRNRDCENSAISQHPRSTAVNTIKLTAPNDEGVSAPPLPDDHTIEHTEAALHAALTFLAAHREEVLRGRADELQYLCGAIFPCMDNDAHFVACVKALEREGHVLTPNPRKRVLSLTKALCGPDDPAATPLTYRRAGRRSQEILELAARGISADQVGVYIRNLANVTMLQNSWRERWRNGGVGIMPGTAQGTLPSGTRFEVTIDPDLAHAIEPSAMDGDQPLSAIRETFKDGRVAFTIKQSDEEMTAMLLPEIEDLPDDHFTMPLVGSAKLFDFIEQRHDAVLRVEMQRDEHERGYLKLVDAKPLKAGDPAADRSMKQTRVAPSDGAAGPRTTSAGTSKHAGSPPTAAASRTGVGQPQQRTRPPYPPRP